MTQRDNYEEQVADLVSVAFDNLGDALKQPAGAHRNALTAKAQLQVEAAQVLATLNLARESRVRALLDVAAIETVGGDPVSTAVAREAYATAVIALGLVEDEDANKMTTEQLMEALGFDGNDPADADLGDLK